MSRARSVVVAEIISLLVLVGLSVMALMWPSEFVLNIVGLALIGLQILALAIAVNSQGRERIFCGVFLAVSLLHTYAAIDERRAAFFPVKEWWQAQASALLGDANGLNDKVAIDQLARIGTLLTSVWLGVLAAAIVQFGVWLRRRKSSSSEPSPVRFAMQVSLRTLLLYMLFCCLAVAWLAQQWRQATALNQAIARLTETCQVEASGYRHPLFPWLSSLIWLDAPQTISSLRVQRECEIPPGLPPVKSVTLAGYKPAELTCRSLVNLHGVEELKVNGKMHEAHLDCLSGLPELRTLWLGDIDLGDEGLQHVASHPHLVELGRRADSLRITNRGAGLLEKLIPKGLRSWTIKATVDDDGLVRLAAAEPGYLYLTNCQLSNAGIQQLGQMSGLRVVQFEDTDLSCVALQPLTLLEGLHTLRLVRCNINETALRELSAILNLDALLVEQPGLTNSSLAIIREFPLLRTATFVGTDISTEAVERFNASTLRPQAQLAQPRERVVANKTADPKTKVER